jgi:hypothetical protein
MATMNMATVSVSSTSYTAVTSPSVTVGFEPDSILLLNRSSTAADVVFISFDGVNDHGILIPGTLPVIEYKEKRTKIWLRLDSGAATTSVNVMAGTVR